MGNKSRFRPGDERSWKQLLRDEPRRTAHVPPFRLAPIANNHVVGVFWNSSKAGTYRNPKPLNSQVTQ